MARRKLDPTLRTQAVEAFKAGNRAVDVAKLLGVSLGTVYRWLREPDTAVVVEASHTQTINEVIQ
jgi:transposase